MNIKEIFTVENAVSLATMLSVMAIFFITFIKTLSSQLNSALKKNDKEKATNWTTLQDKVTMNQKIMKKLEEEKELLGADRILVFDFHNGEHFANGRSAIRFSATYEVVRYGISEVQLTSQTLPLSIISNLIARLFREDSYYLDDIEKAKGSQPEYTLCKNLDMQAFYTCLLKGEGNIPIGFISVQYKETPRRINVRELERLTWYIEESLKEETNTIKKNKEEELKK